MTTNARDTQLVKIALIALAAVLILPLFFMGFGPMMGGMWGGHMWGDGTVPEWMVLVGLVMQLVFLAVLVGAGYLVYRALTTSGDADRALEELRLAYARGDLTHDEFEQRKEALDREP